MIDNYALTESTYYILLALYRPAHGYGIMQQVEEMSQGRVRLAPGTLYGALNALSDKGWIKPLPVEAGSRKKEYKLTDAGLKVLLNEIERLKELVNNGDKVLKDALEGGK
ncbi:MAG: helix-turn-helix transcriptional regulator [Firmicutes bacterium]|nr:helix-turn-helix transcriptional regulator [Bacillota bacterium]